MASMTVRLSEEEREALRLFAQREGRSIQSVMREAIVKEVSITSGDKYGAFDSGDPTITANWDENLKGFGEWR